MLNMLKKSWNSAQMKLSFTPNFYRKYLFLHCNVILM